MSNISKQEYERRFGHRFRMSDTKNAIGYGFDTLYIPPLNKPQYGQTVYYKNLALLMSMGPLGTGSHFLSIMSRAYKSGDFWDTFYYNNASAVGS